MSVTSLAAYKEEQQPHLSGPAKCYQCAHEFVAVAPSETVQLHCPSCGSDKAAFQGFINSGERWECNCGCDLFVIRKGETHCASCGKPQRFP